jgi:antibiotic biosynthesis monooxygenase (ABM) superfamily enzyme
MTEAPPTPPKQPATWKLILAAVLDFITAFVGFGFLVAWLTGGLTANGFSLTGAPALVCFLLIIAYFVVFNRYLGGTIWRWILGARKVRA